MGFGCFLFGLFGWEVVALGGLDCVCLGVLLLLVGLDWCLIVGLLGGLWFCELVGFVIWVVWLVVLFVGWVGLCLEWFCLLCYVFWFGVLLLVGFKGFCAFVSLLH